jgi:hypothetical protein
MRETAVHRLERKSRLPRAGDELAVRLREEMDRRGLTAKEVARLVCDHTDYTLDFRAVQNAMAGSCSFDTATILAATFGWGFMDDVLAPIMRVSRLAALEEEYARQRAAMQALDQQLELHLALAPVADRGLRLVSSETRSWHSQGGLPPSPSRPSLAGKDR